MVTAEVESQRRRGRDHLTVTVAVRARVGGRHGRGVHRGVGRLREAAAGDPAGWDWAGASAEVVPVARLAPRLGASER
jgi:hypothetical protein